MAANMQNLTNVIANMNVAVALAPVVPNPAPSRSQNLLKLM
jgi:hypothetical protein